MEEMRALPRLGVCQAHERLLGSAITTPADRSAPPRSSETTITIEEATPPAVEEEEEEVPPLPTPLDIHPPLLPEEPPLTPPPLPRGSPPPADEAEGRRDEDRQEKKKEWSKKEEEVRKALLKLHEQYTEKLKPFEKRSLLDEEWHEFCKIAEELPCQLKELVGKFGQRRGNLTRN